MADTTVETSDEEAKISAARKERQNAATLRWRKKNAERVKTVTAAWRATHREHQSAYNKQYYAQNAERLRERTRQYRRNNPEKVTAANLAWRKANKDKYAAGCQRRLKIWIALNPESCKEHSQRRRARKISAPGTHTADDIKRIFAAQKRRCALCKASIAKGYHIDHIKPLSKGGSNWPNNLQLLCQPCNQRKHAKDPIQFAQELGLLL